jgi:predicted alpha/beta hydrolase family esterase
MLSRRGFNSMFAGAVASSMVPALCRTQGTQSAKNVVLVHGLYADGSCWLDVIPHLQRAGLNVTAVQNPLTSLEEDAAATRRALAMQDGPTVLVGHSFAGTIISETGTDPIVSALVYVAARAPDAGEDFAALAGNFPKPPASAGVVRAGADELVAAKTSTAAWRVKPTWYQVSTEDRTINPELERFLAKRMKATTIELASSHLSLISHSREIAELILSAAARRS